MRFLRLKFLLPVIAGILLVISTAYLGMVFVVQSSLDDITEELDGKCIPISGQELQFTYCYTDEFSFSESYEIVLAGTRDDRCLEREMRVPEMVLPPTDVRKIGRVTFLLSAAPPDYTYCGLRLTVQFANGERLHGFLVAEGGPRRPSERYWLLLTIPENGKPITGMVYDSETTEIFLIVTRLRY